MDKIMVTGAQGFIGTNFIKYLVDEVKFDGEIMIVDKMCPEASLYWRFQRPLPPNVSFLHADIMEVRNHIFPVDGIIHFAAESHVDRAIENAEDFLITNFLGTHALLEYAKNLTVSGVEFKKFLYISTDEVYGDTPVDSTYEFKETDTLNPGNAYSATKAAGEHMCNAYLHTYGVPVVTTRSCNNFGPHQFHEKLIPTVIRNIVEDKPIPVYGEGKNVREWIPVEENCRAIWEVFNRGAAGEIYNIGSRFRMTNLELIEGIIDHLGKGEISFVTDRKGHDLRYALDPSKIETELGWKCDIDEGIWWSLFDTIDWYVDLYKRGMHT